MKVAEAAAGVLQEYYPSAPREHLLKAAEGAGNRVRAEGVNANVRDCFYGAVCALGTGGAAASKKEAGTDHLDAVELDKAMKRCIELQEGLRRS
jgi:hypothetical protein